MPKNQDGAGIAAMLNRELAKALVPTVAAFQAQLLGYENAIVAIIAALDRTGALPTAEAKSAIDAMAAKIADNALNAPQRQVLRRLSDALARAQASPTTQH